MKWPKIPLGEVLKICNTSEPVSQLKEVNLAGVYSFARGLFKRGPMVPSETSYKTFNRLVTDDFVISQPKAWEGAIARVTPEFDSWYLSPVFPTFRANCDRLEPKFLEVFCKRASVWAELQRKSRGIGARRESVSPEQFLSLQIPLPPLSEQKRIVAQIEELAAKVEEAKGLRQKAVNEVAATWHTYLKSIIENGLKKGWDLKPIAEVAEINPPRVKITAYPNDLEVSFVPMSTVDDVTGRITKAEMRQLGEVRKGYTFFIDGDVIFARITPCMQNGKSAIAKGLKS
jgi:type I restriction enzyme S subunit